MCAGTETPAEAHKQGKGGTSDLPGSEDGENAARPKTSDSLRLRRNPRGTFPGPRMARTQPGRGTSDWTRLRRSSRGGRVEQPPAQPGRGTSDTKASEDPQLGGGSKPPTSWGPSQRMNEGLNVKLRRCIRVSRLRWKNILEYSPTVSGHLCKCH